MEPESRIVLGADGTVQAASGSLASGLVDRRLEQCDGLPLEVLESGRALLRQLHAGGKRVEFQTVALDGGNRTVQLVAIEALAIRRAATDVRTLFASKLDVIAAQAAAAGVTLTMAVADDFPAVVHVDGEKLAWAITTLVGSSLRYLQSASHRMHSGTISVRASFDPASSQVTIEAKDDGPGIPADTVKRLFRRDGLNVRGTGLALLLISDICSAHGGTVDVLSSTGPSDHGTTVRLVLPTPGVRN
jgi:signal transduction histidine kinase